MATYDLTQAIPSLIEAGDILNCPYSGTYKQIELPKGTYKLEVWGAQGGSGYGTNTGKGGYSNGIITLQSNTILYLRSGGQGTWYTGDSGNSAGGGYNGGGNVYTASYGGGGGGGSDIRIGQDSLYARVIVAGGGGAEGYQSTQAGYGGGLSGTNGNTWSGYAGGLCGTQTSGGGHTGTLSGGGQKQAVTAGGFGYGGIASGSGSGGGGGGGGWYGGGGGMIGSGGGGSGYVYTSSTASNYPSGCLLNSSYYLTDAQTIAGNTSFTSPTGSSETGHSNDGYVRITVIETIDPTAIPIPSEIKYTYTGSQITPAFIQQYSKYATISGTSSSTDVGLYEITLTLSDSSYRWEDGTSTPKTVVWKITNQGRVITKVTGSGTSGSITNVTLQKGKYKLECWGAQGGSATYSGTTKAGGKGGYSYGTLTVSDSSTVYLCPGGKGTDGSSTTTYAGGYNGGGMGYYYAGGGGGASHIAVVSGLLNTLSSQTDKILLVAGGGGGSHIYGSTTNAYAAIGGYGGGESGGAGSYSSAYTNTSYAGTGGTQQAGGICPSSNSTVYNGTFGQGGRYYSSYTSGGGAGYYGGSGGGNSYTSGGGGSGYVNKQLLSNAETIAGNETFKNPDGNEITGKAGNGVCRITAISILDPNLLDIPAEENVMLSESTVNHPYSLWEDYCTITGKTVASKSGQYTVTLTLKDPSYIWEDGTNSPKKVKWYVVDPYDIVVGNVLDFAYTGSVESLVLPAGKYKLECWGAQGGTRSCAGGKGGYSVGTLTVDSSLNLYLRTGGVGGSSLSTTAGWNGGGTGISSGCGGGGASDIRIGQDSLYSRVIVAGGGGGGGVSSSSSGYGCGGGTTGQMGFSSSNRCGSGGTQTAGGGTWSTTSSTNIGSFGLGGNASGYSCGGGGGGWYGGGGAYDNDSDADGRNGGGGSGYIYTSTTASNYPSGCLLNESYYLTDAETIAGNTSLPSLTGGSETGHAGNGHIRITVLEVYASDSFALSTKINNAWSLAIPLCKVSNQWIPVVSGYVKVNGTWRSLI